MAGLRTSTPPLSDDSTEDITGDMEVNADSEIDFDFTEPGDISYTAAEHELLQALSDRADSSREGSPDPEYEPSVVIDRPAFTVPDPVATVRAPGSKLKTRPSATPADIAAMAAIRRQVSGEQAPPVPSRDPQRNSEELDQLESDVKSSYGREPLAPTQPKRRESFKMKLDIPNDGLGESLGFGLDKEFDRVCENSKKGYLMRQSTKVVVASSRKFSDEEKAATSTTDGRPSSSRGSSAGNVNSQQGNPDRGTTWTKEPWNGKMRGRSFRQSSARRLLQQGTAPPLPGAESNVSNALGTVNENQATTGIEVHEDGAERGRLFVKVVGVKDLDLPLPQDEKSWFQLTLDNGLHCVTTSWLELGKSAPIEQEFELVVFDDLEFQLTLQTKLKAPLRNSTVETLSKTPKQSKGHHFSRFLVSSKRRKEQERKQMQEDEQANAQRLAVTTPTAWDLLHKVVGEDGSFARAYVSLEEHESQAFGRPYVVDVPCFNEWAVDDTSVSSRVTKRGATVRRPPYCIGKLRLELLYVPKPVGARDEDMPKSMNACIRELKEAEKNTSRRWEGFLSQQGGDCPYWRRRFFKLAGSKLTAHHETTMQPRATINLAKAKRLIDDRSQLTKKDASARGGGRRKSAFAEEEEGYMFVEEGFRIRFGNGETIDFYAENAADKDGWMKVLADAVGNDSSGQTQKAWTALVLAKERQQGGLAGNAAATDADAAGNAAAAATTTTTASPNLAGHQAQKVQNHRQSMQVEQSSQPIAKQRPMSVPKPLSRKTVPTSPVKQNFSQLIPSAERHEAPAPKSPWHRADRRQQLRAHTRNKVRSMVL